MCGSVRDGKVDAFTLCVCVEQGAGRLAEVCG